MGEAQVMRIVLRSMLLAVLIGAIAWFAWTVRGVLVLLLVAVILATGLSPIVDAIAGVKPERRSLRLPRGLAVLLLYLGLLLALTLLLVGIVPPLADETEGLVRALPAYVEAARLALRDLGATYPFLQGADERLVPHPEDLAAALGAIPGQAGRVLSVALGVLNSLLSLVLLLVMTLYLIVDGASLRRDIVALLPAENRPLANAIIDRARTRIAAWLIGQVLLSAIIGGTTFVGLVLLGVPYALLLAVVAAIGELIPMLGPILAAVPGVIVASFVSPVRGLLALGLYVVIQQLENHLIVPQVMRRAVDLPPVVVIVALLMGSEVLGVAGAILALPVAAGLGALIGELVALRDGRRAGAASAPAPPGAPAGSPEPRG